MRWGRSSISAFQDDIKRLGGTDVGSAFPPLGAKDFTPYVGQIRSARPDVIMTATAGNDTVRLLTQLKEYGILSNKLTLAGSAGVVTQENVGAMDGAAEGFLSAAGYSIDIDTPANKKFVAAFKKEFQSDPAMASFISSSGPSRRRVVPMNRSCEARWRTRPGKRRKA